MSDMVTQNQNSAYTSSTRKANPELEAEEKRLAEQRAVRRAHKRQLKLTARTAAKAQGFKLGAWEGTYAKIKNGSNKGKFFSLNRNTIEDRPGRGGTPRRK